MKELNFVPKQYIEKQKNKKSIRFLIKYFRTLIIVAIIAIIIPYAVNYSYGFEKKQLEQATKDSNQYVQKQRELSIVKEIYNKRMENVNKLKQHGVAVSKVWQNIEGIVPQNLCITNFFITDDDKQSANVTLEGMAICENDIASFIANIRKGNFFENISLIGISKSETMQGYVFNIKMHAKNNLENSKN